MRGLINWSEIFGKLSEKLVHSIIRDCHTNKHCDSWNRAHDSKLVDFIKSHQTINFKKYKETLKTLHKMLLNNDVDSAQNSHVLSQRPPIGLDAGCDIRLTARNSYQVPTTYFPVWRPCLQRMVIQNFGQVWMNNYSQKQQIRIKTEFVC